MTPSIEVQQYKPNNSCSVVEHLRTKCHAKEYCPCDSSQSHNHKIACPECNPASHLVSRPILDSSLACHRRTDMGHLCEPQSGISLVGHTPTTYHYYLQQANKDQQRLSNQELVHAFNLIQI